MEFLILETSVCMVGKKGRNACQSGLIFQKDLLLEYVSCTTGTSDIFQNLPYLAVYLYLLCFVLFVLCFCIVSFMYIYSYLFCLY